MIAVTLKEARIRLNGLVEKARGGEDVVLLRGSKLVARIVPLSEDNVAVWDAISDEQADRLWRHIAEERRAGRIRTFASPAAAVKHLRKAYAGARRR